MKQPILLTLVLILSQTVFAQTNEVAGGITNPAGRTLSIKVRPSAAFNTTGRNLLTNIVVTVRWPAALGVTLGPTMSPVYGLTLSDSGVVGAYKYMVYAAADNTILNWAANTEYELFTAEVGGTAGGTFELTNALPNGEWYVEINGIDRTDPAFYQGSVALSPLLVINASAGQNGIITPAGSTTVGYGGTQSFVIAPSAGYHVDSLLVDNAKVDSTTSYTFHNVTANHTIRAVFRINQYTIIASAGPNGTITPAGSITVNYGGNQAFAIAPEPGYHVDSLLIDNVRVDSTTGYTFQNVTADHSIRAVFGINWYSITASAGPNGSIAPGGNVLVSYGGNQAFAVSPSTGYHVDSLLVDGVPVDSTTSYTFLNVIANHSIRAVFRIDAYTIFASAGPNGTMTPDGAIHVNHGAAQSFAITPGTGYHLDSLIVDGAKVDSTTGYTFVNVTSNHTIRSVFRINVYTITALAGPHGSVTPNGAVSVDYGADQSFVLTPAGGYHPDSLLIDTVRVDSTTSFTFRDVIANHTLRAVFAINQYTITSTAGPHGTISPEGNIAVTSGADQSFLISPSAGYHVDSLLVDGGLVDSTVSYTFRNVIADHSLRAVFSINQYTITASAGANGSILPVGAVTADYGSDQTFSFNPASGFRTDSVLVDGTPVDSILHYTFTGILANHSIRVSFRPAQVTVSVNTFSGWNMVSCPVVVINDSVRALFQNAAFPYAYSFGGSYAQSYRLEKGKGYWEKFPVTGVQMLSGLPRNADTIHVVAGWNMIGSISSAIDTAAIVSLPPGLRSSTWYGYYGAYQPVTQILPGSAYWVKSAGSGAFVLSPVSATSHAKSISESASDQRYNVLSIEDNKGRSQTLYFGPVDDTDEQSTGFEMPPLPPEGAFDARFDSPGGGTMFGSHRRDQEEVLGLSVQSDAYPLIVRWRISTNDAEYQLTDGGIGHAFPPVAMKSAGEMKLTNAGIRKLSLRVAGRRETPVAFALYRNYPNPFNPATTIAFDVPRDGYVRLRVIDILGRAVATLVDEHVTAGRHSIEWKRSDAASGVYFYRMESGDFTAVMKMVLLK
jgi:hypothetical protein